MSLTRIFSSSRSLKECAKSVRFMLGKLLCDVTRECINDEGIQVLVTEIYEHQRDHVVQVIIAKFNGVNTHSAGSRFKEGQGFKSHLGFIVIR